MKKTRELSLQRLFVSHVTLTTQLFLIKTDSLYYIIFISIYFINI